MTNRPPQEQTPVIEAIALSKTFRDFWRRPKVRAVNTISFEVRRGEVFGLLGPNGSGKSTTLKMILGLLYPSKGTLRVLGHSPRNVRTKKRVGYLPEESYLYPYLTCEETLHFYGKLFDLNSAERHARVEQLLDMIGLRHARHRLISEFSKGMARRIGLAQSLINDPDLIILDEPTSGLDPIGCRQVKDLIETLAQRGKTVLLSSHLLADVEDVCDRIAILYNGHIRAMGPIRELLEERSRYTLSMPELKPDVLKRVLDAVRRELGETPEVEHPRRNLEQFFLNVVAQASEEEIKEQTGADQSDRLAAYLRPSGEASPKASDLSTRMEQPAAEVKATPAPESPLAANPQADKLLDKLTRPDG